MTSLPEVLARHTAEAELVVPIDDRRIRCVACGHRCPIFRGESGVCRVRFNQDGKLRVPWGYVAGAACDPIEKKPFFHVRPGSLAFSFGMLGCDLHCGYCQNWLTSQAVRDSEARAGIRPATPEELIESAVSSQAHAVVSTYNEPLITAEWAAAIFREAKAAGLVTGFVSNGNATPEVLEYLRPWTDLYKVDLKSFNPRRYRELGGRIEPILESIRRIHEMGFWLETVTLVVPGFNDSDEELKQIAGFLAGIAESIPWHVTAYHRGYKMTAPPNTTASTLQRAYETGRSEGLQYVYTGNLPGELPGLEDTRCHGCGHLLVRRQGFRVLANEIHDGTCPSCGASIPGRW